MGVSYLSVSTVSTLLSFASLQWCAHLSVEKLKSDGLIGQDFIYSANATRTIELLLHSHLLVALLATFALNVFILFILCFKVSHLLLMSNDIRNFECAFTETFDSLSYTTVAYMVCTLKNLNVYGVDNL